VSFVTSNKIDIAVISDLFEDKSLEERESIINKRVREISPSIVIGFASLYTHYEAEAIGVSLQSNKYDLIYKRPSTWFDLIDWGLKNKAPIKNSEGPKTISFYSYKGGVGRTTALTHVAWILASRGKKVVVVDLDFEAPSLHKAMKLNSNKVPDYGLVDYLYERLNSSSIEVESSINIWDIIGEVNVAKGRLFVVPSSTKINSDYVLKVDDLRNLDFTDNSIWEGFKNELQTQVNPDLILIDSRTGINIWGALSLLTISDSPYVFMSPNAQNSEGVSTIISSLYKVGIEPNIIMSPVIGDVGKSKAIKIWGEMLLSQKEVGELPEDISSDFGDPLMIPYASEIALADSYPYQPLLPLYYDIANKIDNDSDKLRLVSLISGPKRWSIIESLRISSVDAKNEESIKDMFQKTADFDRFLDQSTVLIKGKKGTGKTQLYWTSLRHTEVIKKYAKERLESVLFISGHGPADAHPVRVHFSFINDKLIKEEIEWESFWSAYALYKIINKSNIKLPTIKKFTPLNEVIKTAALDSNDWSMEHTNLIIRLVTQSDLRLLVIDALKSVNEKLNKTGQYLWLLYDDLDQDIQEYSRIQQDAISGLFSFALMLDSVNARNIRPKIFLRSDIWQRLNFTNKSHLNGRDIELRWNREDFLRLSLRQAQRSKEFADLVSRFSPVPDVDLATEEILEKALELLWGIDRERSKSKKVSRWVYERLTDASGSTFPRALIVLLNGAKEHELEFQYQTHLQTPADRLLRFKSLNEGLIRASQFRCEELKQEYKELDDLGFFENLKNIWQITELEPLKQWLDDNPNNLFKTFNDMVDFIEQIGLASRYEASRWKFADIYVHGFQMKRSGGRL